MHFIQDLIFIYIGDIKKKFDVQDVIFTFQTLEESQNYHDAVQKLAYTVTTASVYHIVGGVNPGEGVVVTKGRELPIDFWQIDTAVNR